MDVLLDDDERAILDQSRNFLAGTCTPTLVRSAEAGDKHAPALWREMLRLGWLDTGLPESAGGLGLPMQFVELLFEEAGRNLAPVPLISTMASVLILARHGLPRHQQALNDLRSGASIACFAVQEADGAWSPQAIRMTGRPDGEAIVLDGIKMFVDNYALSQRCLVAFRLAGASGLSLALVDTASPGLSHIDLVTTAKDSQAQVRFDAVRVPMDAFVGEPGGADAAVADLMDLATLFCTAQMVGAARRATEFAIEYAKQRVAFEQPIGSFQAIQHLCADMQIGVDGAELLCREAAWKRGQGENASVEISQAKAFANEKCVMACRSAQQIHGGMGFMMEFDLQLWYRRVAAWSMRYGTTQEHRRRIADHLLSQPAPIRLDGCPVL